MRLLDIVATVAVLAGLGAAAVLLQRGESLAGKVAVVDGDSLRLDGRDIRLQGIDAPELHQTCLRDGRPWPCGEIAKQELRRATQDARVSCAVSGRDRYGRSLARCAAGGRDLGALMVEEGLAVAYGAYEAEEGRARERQAGLWAGSFERPSDWRKLHPRPVVARTNP